MLVCACVCACVHASVHLRLCVCAIYGIYLNVHFQFQLILFLNHQAWIWLF